MFTGPFTLSMVVGWGGSTPALLSFFALLIFQPRISQMNTDGFYLFRSLICVNRCNWLRPSFECRCARKWFKIPFLISLHPTTIRTGVTDQTSVS